MRGACVEEARGVEKEVRREIHEGAEEEEKKTNGDEKKKKKKKKPKKKERARGRCITVTLPRLYFLWVQEGKSHECVVSGPHLYTQQLHSNC